MKNATDVSASVQGRKLERGPALKAGAVLIGFEGITSSCVITRLKHPRPKWP